MAQLRPSISQKNIVDKDSDLETIIENLCEKLGENEEELKKIALKKVKKAEKEKKQLREQLSEQETEMRDLKSELDLLKRRIERQENDYIQTMRLNTMLKNQVLELQQNGDGTKRKV